MEINQHSTLKKIKRKKIEILQQELGMWKRKCEELIQKNNNLEEQIRKMKVLPNLRTLETIFTPGQIRLLLNPSKRKIRWNANDIASAISLRSVSPKAYHFLRNHNFSLPGLCICHNSVNGNVNVSVSQNVNLQNIGETFNHPQ
jgi:hypothetical protein